MEAIKKPKPCHDYQFNGECQKLQCKFSHDVKILYRCNFRGSECTQCEKNGISQSERKFKRTQKKCHHYELYGKCKNEDCKYEHSTFPSMECINQGDCKYCEKAEQNRKPKRNNNENKQKTKCHSYELYGKCKNEDCKFEHSTFPSMKCIKQGDCKYCKKAEENQKHKRNYNETRQKKKCHHFELYGKCKNEDCKFEHSSSPSMTCINQDDCKYCKKATADSKQQKNRYEKRNYNNMEYKTMNDKNEKKSDNISQYSDKNDKSENNNQKQKKSKKQCHVYQLSGNCNKQQGCRYEHSQLPQMTCTIKNCVLCCHEYHLKGKCRKIAICRKLHLGIPLGKCINDGVCYKCNKACHQYQMRGKCKKGKVCRFDHTGVVLKKCPFGSKNCHLCQFTREKRGPCHYLYATGTCKLGNRCQFSHKFKVGANQCMNYFCNVKGCQNYTPPLEERNDLVSSHISQIVSQINESDIYPDQLKAAELIQDNEIINNKEKTEAEEKLVNVRQSIKRSLGFNYIATKEIKGVYIQGEGIFYTPGGVQGSIKIKEQEVELNIGGKVEKQKLDKGYQSQLANILVRKSKYYEANQNSQQSQSDTEEEQELKVFKNTNKNNQLSEQAMIYMPSPINAIVGGDFTICKDKNLNKKVKFEPIQQKKVLKYVKDNAERIKSEMAKFDNNMEQLKKEKEKFCVEICFLIDTTASMGSYITESKNTMKNIINQISEKVKGTKFEIKFGVVCYRDHCDDKQGSYLVQGKDFEKEINIILDYINTVDSRGGGDVPEAVVDGINQALKLSWSKNENSWGGSQRIIFHIADAPPHGDIYKDEDSYGGDNHPNGCPCGLKFNKLSTQINNNDISYHLVAIGSSLKKTIKVFENSLQSFNYCNIQGASQMTENIIEMLTKYPWWNVKA